jgi:plastocyanin
MHRTPRSRAAIVAAGAFLLASFVCGTAVAYQETSVENAATLTGIVRLGGALPATEQIIVEKDVQACGDTLESQAILVGSSKGVANAIVTIEGITTGKPIPLADSLALTNYACQFVPRVQVVQVGSRVDIRNADDVLHNIHATLGGESLFNIALPTKDLHVRKDFSKPGLVQIVCDAGHTWMRAYVLVTDHPYHAITGNEGAFTIADVPAGTYTVKVWHEALGTQTREVVLRPSERATIEFDLTGGGASGAASGGAQ